MKVSRYGLMKMKNRVISIIRLFHVDSAMWKSVAEKISLFFVKERIGGLPQKTNGNWNRLIELCAMSSDEALRSLSTSEQGLNQGQVESLQKEFGPNEISRAKRASFLSEIFQRFKNPLVVLLLIIAVVSLLMGDLRSTLVVSGMILISVFLAHIQEMRSNRAVEKLRAMVQTNANVLREGKEIEIPMSELVPGDILLLDAGALIPADIRLISAKDFYIHQSALTGESMPIEKSAAPCTTTGKGILELQNACFMGSSVLSGTAKGVVVNTGSRTYFGSLSQRLASQRVLTSFDKGIAGFTWLMIRFMSMMVCVVFLIVGLTKGNWIEALMFGLAVAVGLTPEMLPMIVTVNLAKGARAMSKKKVIVKRLNAIQNLGAVDILCTDKTGTLTQDRVVLERYVDVTNRESEDVLRYAYMNSYYQTGLRNLLDRAILSHSEFEVERSCRKVDEIPFDFLRKRMSVVVEYEGAHVLICKGAVEDVYKVCQYYQVDDEIHPLIDVIKYDLMEEYQSLSEDGYRVLAVAYREFSREKDVFSVSDESHLVLLGYIAFFDPPKDSAVVALEHLRRRGISVKILTGDNELVAKKVCRDVGIPSERVLTGDQLQGATPNQLEDWAETTTIFARLSPSQKEEIIHALQRRGHVVGFLGDGINDTLAMRGADVGISVDTAVDVAKESADIVLLEKSLLVLEDGIVEGRRVFGNIIKYIRMGASSNFGNMFSVVGGSYFLPFLPMAPIQILLNNLLYDISQVGIPTDKVDPEFTETPRKWDIGNIKKFMIFIGPMSSLFDYATYGLMLFFFKCNQFLNPDILPYMKAYYEKLFHTGWFVESILTQTMIVHIIRTRKIPFFQSVASPGLLITTLFVIAMGAFLPYSPLAETFGFVPLPAVYWLWIFGFLLAYAVLTHRVKGWFFNRYGVD
jgi:Mg2+-importing ATPase